MTDKSVFDVAKKTKLQGFAADACERHWSVIGSVIFSPFVKPGKQFWGFSIEQVTSRLKAIKTPQLASLTILSKMHSNEASPFFL